MNTESSLRAPRNCSPLPPQELDRIRTLLREREAALLLSCQGLSHAALKKAGSRGGDGAPVTDDPADLAAETTEQDLSIQMLGRLQAELEDIRGALERVEERSYGVCEECGQRIPEARLEALPTAGTCVKCKAASENA